MCQLNSHIKCHLNLTFIFKYLLITRRSLPSTNSIPNLSAKKACSKKAELYIPGVSKTIFGFLFAFLGEDFFKISDKYFRPTEVDQLLGDSSKALKNLHWKPKYTFKDLVKEMVEYDCTN